MTSKRIEERITEILQKLEEPRDRIKEILKNVKTTYENAVSYGWSEGRKELDSLCGGFIILSSKIKPKVLAIICKVTSSTMNSTASAIRYYISLGRRNVLREEKIEREKLELTPSQSVTAEKMTRTLAFFFRERNFSVPIPFRGFLLTGPPGHGKTALVKEVANCLKYDYKMSLGLKLIDSSNIAKKFWGDAERVLANLFRPIGYDHTLIFLDDMDCLFLKRGNSLTREYHMSINSVLMHQLDCLNPASTLVIATSNQPELLDPAIKSRLYEIEVSRLPIGELMEVAIDLLGKSWPPDKDDEFKEDVMAGIFSELAELEEPSVRDVEHLIVKHCIEADVWSRQETEEIPI